MTSDHDLLPGFRDELVAAAGRRLRQQRRRRLGGSIAAAALGAVGLVAALSVAQSDVAEAGVEITERDGRIVVSLTDIETRPDVVEEALTDAGIDADVTAVPVGPSNVGRFTGVVTSDAEEVQPLDERGHTFPGFTVPVDYEGLLVLYLGRPAEPGESYQVGSDAFREGEPLECVDLLGRPATAIVDLAADRPELRLRAHAYADAAAAVEQLEARDIPGSPFADYLVAEAFASSAEDVLLILTPDGSTPGPGEAERPAPCPD